MKRIIVFIVMIGIMMNINTVTSSASTIIDSGTCGENLTWTFDSEGILTVSGTGKMNDFERFSDVPWQKYASEIQTVSIEDGVTSIGCRAFYSCTSMTDVQIPTSVTSVGDISFSSCSSLTHITIPQNVVTIGESAFNDCLALLSIDVDLQNEYYSSDQGVLFNKSKTELILFPSSKSGDYIIPNGTISIKSDAFTNCNQLRSVTFPEGFTDIPESTFDICNELESIIIPESVTNISPIAFIRCNKLNISVDSNNSYYSDIDGVLFNKDKTKLIRYAKDKIQNRYSIPEGTEIIGDHAFYFCTYLEHIDIPNGVYEIEGTAFFWCLHTFKSVKIPSSVKTIGVEAFNFSYLQDVYYEGSQNDWNSIEIGMANQRLTEAEIHYNAIGINPPVITDVKPINNGTDTGVRVELKNAEYDSALFVVFSNNGMMTDIKMVNVSAGDNEVTTSTEYKDIDGVKAFIWSSFDSMQPLCQSKKIEF